MQVGARSLKGSSLFVKGCLALPFDMRAQTREVTRVQTAPDQQGQGHATELMRQVCDEADRAGITLVLWPRPFGEWQALSQGMLADWYARAFGFAELQPEPLMMVRSPGTMPTRQTATAIAAAGYGA